MKGNYFVRIFLKLIDRLEKERRKIKLCRIHHWTLEGNYVINVWEHGFSYLVSLIKVESSFHHFNCQHVLSVLLRNKGYITQLGTKLSSCSCPLRWMIDKVFLWMTHIGGWGLGVCFFEIHSHLAWFLELPLR